MLNFDSYTFLVKGSKVRGLELYKYLEKLQIGRLICDIQPLDVKNLWWTVLDHFAYGMLSSSNFEYSFKFNLGSTCDSFFYHLFEQLIDFSSEVVNLEHKKMEFYMSSQILHYKLVECVRSSRKTDEE